MGSKILAIFIIFFIVLTTFSLSDVTMDENFNEEIMHALHLSAEAALLKWDLPKTADAGIIVLDRVQAETVANEFFVQNTSQLPTDRSKFVIDIVNDAPCIRNIRGAFHSFISNGVYVEYEDLYYVLEVDDR